MVSTTRTNLPRNSLTQYVRVIIFIPISIVMDSPLPLQWPEPIVRVQSLADSSPAAVPDKYIKPPADRPGSVPDVIGPAEVPTIPVIDVGCLVGGGGGDEAAVMRAVSDACREWGFLQVVNHGVSWELLGKAKEVWRKFFHLPFEEKEVFSNDPKTFEGYGSRLGVQKGAILDWGDYFFLHFRPESLKNHEKWPALPTFLRETTEDYCGQLVNLCKVLMKALSISLGLREDFLHKSFGGEEAGATLRVNFYPKCPQPDLTLGLSAHSDPGCLTVLFPDDHVRGLQVRKGDAWLSVQPVRDALVINIADQIEVLSNATYKSVEHRVITNSTQERLSLAFFYNPKSDLVIEPAREFVAPDRPPLYKPMTYNEYRLYMRKNGPRGKSQVDSMKTTT